MTGKVYPMRINSLLPIEVSAFYILGRLHAADIQPICEHWMEEGLGKDEVACLAFEPCLDLWHSKRDIEAAITEVIGDLTLSRLEATWIVFRYYIAELLETENDLNARLGTLINLTYENHPALFERDDPKYAASEYGIERLLGIYYSRDHLPDWPPRASIWSSSLGAEFERFKEEVDAEAKIVLARFFSSDSELPENLKRVQRLVETHSQ